MRKSAAILDAMMSDVTGELIDSATRASIEELESKLAGKTAECSVLEARMQDAQNRCTDLQTRLTAEEQECKSYESRCNQLTDELTEWKVKCAGLESALQERPTGERVMQVMPAPVVFPNKTEAPRDYEILVDRGGDNRVRKFKVKFS